MRLEGKRILLTRPRDQVAEMAGAIEQHGGIPVLIPMIRILPAHYGGSEREVMARTPLFDAIVFASANAVSYYLDALLSCGIPESQLSAHDVYAVGKKTREALERRGVSVTATPQEYSGAALAELLRARDLRGKRMLFPRGGTGRDDVIDAARQAGAECTSLVVYRTIGPEPADADHARNAILERTIDIATFASPSALRNFRALFTEEQCLTSMSGLVIAAIGGTTAATAEELGLAVHVRSAEATARGLIDALIHY